MKEDVADINKYLYPAAWLYGAGVKLRNKLFDWGILRSKSFSVPIITIGNLAVGGTGKTPHTEYLIKLLSREYAVAVLSRGYKRKTKGYILANEQSTAKNIGDEPLQIKNKFPGIRVAVDEKRVRGVEKLMTLDAPPVEVILLDDAYQHRYVKAGLNILLTDYNRLFSTDKLLPAGRLREPEYGKDRAQIVIVTKCPDDLKPIEYNVIGKQLRLFAFQQLYFSRIRYGHLAPVHPQPDAKKRALHHLKNSEAVLLVTGIASANGMVSEIKKHTPHVTHLSFADHHNFDAKDMKQINDSFRALKDKFESVLIITTEKDAARMSTHQHPDEKLKAHLYALPIEIEILQNKQHSFNQNIINYVKESRRNSRLPKI